MGKSEFHSKRGGARIRNTLAKILGATAAIALVVAISGSPRSADFAAPPPSKLQGDSSRLAFFLTRTLFSAIIQGQLTGNYTVLRDLGTPTFQSTNTAADLSAVFVELENDESDLSETVFLDPEITDVDFFKDRRQIRIRGDYRVRGEKVEFELVYEKATHRFWMIDSIWISTASTACYVYADKLRVAPAAEYSAEDDTFAKALRIMPIGTILEKPVPNSAGPKITPGPNAPPLWKK